MANTKNRKLHRRAFELAKQEASELREEAIKIDVAIQKAYGVTKDFPIGRMIAANVLISLSIELYLKTFMIVGRNKGVKTGHNLADIYSEFPDFLKTEIESRYRLYPRSNNTMVVEQAFVVSQDPPPIPQVEPFNGIDFNDFNSTMGAISNKFTESRYFFENVNNSGWAIFKYYFDPARIVASVLHEVLDKFMRGEFEGQGTR